MPSKTTYVIVAVIVVVALIFLVWLYSSSTKKSTEKKVVTDDTTGEDTTGEDTTGEDTTSEGTVSPIDDEMAVKKAAMDYYALHNESYLSPTDTGFAIEEITKMKRIDSTTWDIAFWYKPALKSTQMIRFVDSRRFKFSTSPGMATIVSMSGPWEGYSFNLNQDFPGAQQQIL